MLQASGEGGFGIGVQFNLEFQMNFGQITTATETSTTVSSYQENLNPSGSAGDYQVQPTGWLVALTTAFAAYVYQFNDVNGHLMAGSVSYAQVYATDSSIKIIPYQIVNPAADVDLSQRPYLPPTPGDLSTYIRATKVLRNTTQPWPFRS